MFSSRSYLLLRSCLTMAATQSSTSASTAAFSTTVHLSSKHYETLGISPNSTQSDIKAAYYQLSMQFHPDKNQGNEMAKKKFVEISEAYEVLGNYRLRRLYDKGIIHTAGSQYAQKTDIHDDIAPEVEDDAETKFYKSRFRKTQVADAMGRTPIYDFDEWSRAHYGKSFERRQSAKEKYHQKQGEKRRFVYDAQNEIVLFGFIICMAITLAIFFTESSYDTPKDRAERVATAVKVEKSSNES